MVETMTGGRALEVLFGVDPHRAGSRRILLMSFGFFFIFIAFTTTQTVLSTVFADYHGAVSGQNYDLGDVSLMIIYATLCLSLYGVSNMIQYLGAVRTMIIGGVCYFVFITALIVPWEPTVLAASCIVGFGQAAIWVGQGVVLTHSSTESTRGVDAGLFWGVYSASSIVGEAFGFVVFKGTDATGFFIFAAIMTVFGTQLLRQLKMHSTPRVASYGSILDDDDGDEDSSLLEKKQVLPTADELAAKLVDGPADLMAAITTGSKTVAARMIDEPLGSRRWTREKLGVLASMGPLMIFVGSSDAFVNGTFPLIFAPDQDQESGVFLVFLGWGISETLGAVLLSRLSDRIGRRAVLVFAAGAYVAGLLICWAIFKNPRCPPTITNVSWLAFVAGVLFGLNDTLNNTQVMALIGDHFADPRLNVDAFVVFHLLQSLGMTIGFLLPLVIPTESNSRELILILQLAFLLLAVAGVVMIEAPARHKQQPQRQAGFS